MLHWMRRVMMMLEESVSVAVIDDLIHDSVMSSYPHYSLTSVYNSLIDNDFVYQSVYSLYLYYYCYYVYYHSSLVYHCRWQVVRLIQNFQNSHLSHDYMN